MSDNCGEPEGELCLLSSFFSEQELLVVLSILNGAGIPTEVVRPGVGDYVHIYMGVSSFETQVYVRSEYLEAANALLFAMREQQ